MLTGIELHQLKIGATFQSSTVVVRPQIVKIFHVRVDMSIN